MLRALFKEETVFSKQEIKKEIWKALPIWFLYIEAMGLLNFMMANVDPKRYEAMGYSAFQFAITAALPIFWIVFYYLFRIKNSDRLINKGYYYILIPTLLVLPALFIYFLYSFFPFLRIVLPEQYLRFLFELMQVFWIIIFLIHAALFYNRQKFITFFVVAFVYGLLLENFGIILGYFHETDYMFYLGRLPAPFATMMGWCLVFYICIWISNFFQKQIPWFKKTPIRAAFLTTAIALSLDFQLDPLASLSGVFWKWHDALPDWYLGVPFCNYAAWFGAFMPFAWAYYYLQDREDLTETQRNWKLLMHVPWIAILAGAIWLAIMTVYDGSFSGPTFQILYEFINKIMPY